MSKIQISIDHSKFRLPVFPSDGRLPAVQSVLPSAATVSSMRRLRQAMEMPGRKTSWQPGMERFATTKDARWLGIAAGYGKLMIPAASTAENLGASFVPLFPGR